MKFKKKKGKFYVIVLYIMIHISLYSYRWEERGQNEVI